MKYVDYWREHTTYVAHYPSTRSSQDEHRLFRVHEFIGNYYDSNEKIEKNRLYRVEQFPSARNSKEANWLMDSMGKEWRNFNSHKGQWSSWRGFYIVDDSNYGLALIQGYWDLEDLI